MAVGPMPTGPMPTGPVPSGPVPTGPVPTGPMPTGAIPGRPTFGTGFAPALATRTILGMPIHVLLLVAAGIGLISMFMAWESMDYSPWVDWQTTGYKYSDGSSSTWQVPVTGGTFTAGSTGFGPLQFLLVAGTAGLAIAFRNRAWPRWAGITLAVMVALMIWAGLMNGIAEEVFGPLLFAIAGGMAVPAVVQILRGRSA